MSTKTQIDLDLIELENEALDVLEFEEDVMSDPIMSLSTQELIEQARIAKENVLKEEQKKREELQRKKAYEKRIALLNEENAYKAYNKLMQDLPQFDDALSEHWTGHLCAILHRIKYKHSVETLANKNAIIGDIEAISIISIVKSHLSLATFDHMYVQMKDFLIENPTYQFNNDDVEKIFTLAYEGEHRFELDENSDTSADPEWGSY